MTPYTTRDSYVLLFLVTTSKLDSTPLKRVRGGTQGPQILKADRSSLETLRKGAGGRSSAVDRVEEGERRRKRGPAGVGRDSYGSGLRTSRLRGQGSPGGVGTLRPGRPPVRADPELRTDLSVLLTSRAR